MTVSEVLARHEKDLDEYAEKFLGGKVPEHNKHREIVSGETIEGRSEMLQILKKIESPKIKAVLVKECSRLGRPDLEEIGRLSKLFRFTNTLIITPQRIFDLRDEYDREAFEREMMRSNDYLNFVKKVLRAGRERSVADGCYIGSVPPYGFDKTIVMDGKSECPTLKENKEQADVVRMIFDMYANKNMGRTSICVYLDKIGVKPKSGKAWSASAIREILTNVHYIGKIKWNWRPGVSIVENGEVIKKRPQANVKEYMVFEGRHNGIVSEELFNAVQDKLGRNPRVTKNNKVRNPFATLLYCGKCGKTMTLQVHPAKDGKMKCAPRLTCLRQSRCGIGSCTYDEVMERVCEVLAQCIEDFEIRLKNNEGDSVKLHARLVKNLEQKLKDLEAKELSQWEAQAHPDPSQRMPAEIFKKLNEKLLQEKEEVREALCNAYESMPEPVDYEEKIRMFSDALEALKDPDVEPIVKNELLKACIDRIDYYRERPQRKQPAKGNGTFPMIATQWSNPPIELDVKLRV
ncbi:MAG: recombinase family protein [Clostridia bacterium]|nr:recombinase family protein [Clostridia bacterium]